MLFVINATMLKLVDKHTLEKDIFPMTIFWSLSIPLLYTNSKKTLVRKTLKQTIILYLGFRKI